MPPFRPVCLVVLAAAGAAAASSAGIVEAHDHEEDYDEVSKLGDLPEVNRHKRKRKAEPTERVEAVLNRKEQTRKYLAFYKKLQNTKKTVGAQ